ncbi:MAG TPA: hypothetical protein PKB00_04510 [Microthrixaceae bacterium]|nr:hypothetical protein [Microthrixaceae bacterium]
MSDRPDECLCDVPPFRGHRSGGRAVKASELAARLAGLGPTWDTCKRLDADARLTLITQPPALPEVVRWRGEVWNVKAITCDRAYLYPDGDKFGWVAKWVPLDELEVVR